MQWRTPKNSEKYHWTAHVAEKMHYYGLSEQKVLGVIRRPKRIETGIAPDTVAVMVPVGEKSAAQIAKNKDKKSSFGNYQSDRPWNQEIWVMYQIKNLKFKISNLKLDAEKINPTLKKLQNKINTKKQLTIISAWRYPGVSSEKDPIPAEIWREIEEAGIIKE
jgi:hypothetical protein